MENIKISELLVVSMFVVGLGTAMVHKINNHTISTINIVEVSSQQKPVTEPAS